MEYSQRVDVINTAVTKPITTQKVKHEHQVYQSTFDPPQISTMAPLIIQSSLVVSRKPTLQIFASLGPRAHSIVTARSANSRASVIYIILLGTGGLCLTVLELAGWGGVKMQCRHTSPQ